MQGEFVFPQDAATEHFPDRFQRVGGLELRDYFASRTFPAFVTISAGASIEIALEKAAKLAYQSADALLKAKRGE